MTNGGLRMEGMDILTRQISDGLKGKGLLLPDGGYSFNVQSAGSVPAVHPDSTTQQFVVTVTGVLPKVESKSV